MNIKKLTQLFIGLVLFGCFAYLVVAFTIGVRIPGFHLDNFQLPTTYENKKDGFKLDVEGGFIKQIGHQFVIRAYSPHLEISLIGHLITFPLVIENIHPDARLIVNNDNVTFEEKRDNLKRSLTIHGQINSPMLLKWLFPEKDHYRFMALGDTGGGKELEWALIRAKQLNADFVVHLGDMFYSPQDVHSAFSVLQNSPVPVFNIYGNHDYQNGDDEYPQKNTFNKIFAPSNFQFSLLGKSFVSLDTASHIFPFNKGKRGSFIQQLIDQPSPKNQETLLFTHKPIVSVLAEKHPELDHGVTGFESFWLEGKLASIDSLTIITGHIHKSIEILDIFFPTYIAGEGIAHTDLITNKPHSKVLVGDLYLDQPTQFSWHTNNIPRSYQVSKKSLDIWARHQRNLASNDVNSKH